MDLITLLPFLGASVLLTLMPGPDIIFVVALSIANGKKAGIVTALGLCTGLIAHTTAAALGVSVLLLNSEIAFSMLKYLGAAYLVYLGVEALLPQKQTETSLESGSAIAYRKLYVKGIFMNVLNPKVSLFFLAFLPQFVDVNTKSPSTDMIWLGAIFMLQAIVVFTLVALLANGLSQRLRSNKSNSIVKWFKAVIFFGIAISLLF